MSLMQTLVLLGMGVVVTPAGTANLGPNSIPPEGQEGKGVGVMTRSTFCTWTPEPARELLVVDRGGEYFASLAGERNARGTRVDFTCARSGEGLDCWAEGRDAGDLDFSIERTPPRASDLATRIVVCPAALELDRD